jgi:HD-GYP domain-containing protein (c-di-GMP phosphodiesterase class II)
MNDLLAREIILCSLSAIRTIQSHGPDNRAVGTALMRLADVVNTHLDEHGGTLDLQIVDEMFLLNGARIRANATQLAQYRGLIEILLERAIGGLSFLRAVDLSELHRWYTVLAQREPQGVLDALATLDCGIRVLGFRTLTTTDTQEALRLGTMAFAMQAYARTLLAFRAFVDSARAGRDPYTNRLSVVRVIQDLIDVAASRADFLFHIIHLQKAKSAELGASYAEVHAVNTAVYAILIGRILRLERTALLDLGTSALLADAGSALMLGEELGATATVLSAQEKQQIQTLMTRAVQALLGTGGNDQAVLLRAIVAYERQRPLTDEAGNPFDPLLLCSRIVALASAYDAMTTDRPWRRAMLPARALSTITSEAPQKFDRTIVSTLAALVQTYERSRA